MSGAGLWQRLHGWMSLSESFWVEGKRLGGLMIVVLVSGGSTRALVFRVLPPSFPSFLFYFSKAVTALVILKCSLSKQSFQLSLSFLYNLSPYGPRAEAGIATLCGKTPTSNHGSLRKWNPRPVHLGRSWRFSNQETDGPPSKVVSPVRQPRRWVPQGFIRGRFLVALLAC